MEKDNKLSDNSVPGVRGPQQPVESDPAMGEESPANWSRYGNPTAHNSKYHAARMAKFLWSRLNFLRSNPH